jgi:TorA maturation chaperone TorD
MLAGRIEASQSSQSQVENLAAVLQRDQISAPDEIDAARAREYALLAALLRRTPDRRFLDRLAELKVDASPIGLAHAALAEAARAVKLEEVEREFFDLFIGIGRGEVMPYGSYYLTGFLYERPLARLRSDLAELGIARSQDNYEPEDHIATLCEIMAGLAGAEFPAPRGSDERIFKKHVEPWAARFFGDLEHAPAARFYRSVGLVGRTFIEIESEAYALPA